MSNNQINYEAIGRDVYLSKKIHSFIRSRQSELKGIACTINETCLPYSQLNNEYRLFNYDRIPEVIEMIKSIDNQFKELLPEQNKWAKIAGGEPIVIEGLIDVR
nr:hypothetical protein [Proteus mirabilis]